MSPDEIAREAFYLLYLAGLTVVAVAEFYGITRIWRRR